jgi:hypothetical protein
MTNNKTESIEDLAKECAREYIGDHKVTARECFERGAAACDEHYRAVVSALENTSGGLETLLTKFNLDLIPSVRLAFMGMVLRSRAALQNVKK